MPVEGIEPTLPCGNQILSLARTLEIDRCTFILARVGGGY